MKRLFWLGLLLLGGCGSGEGDPGPAPMPAKQQTAAPVCEAGKTAACPCVNGGQGVQSCADDGSKWGACECQDVKPPVPIQTPSQGCNTRVDVPPGPQGCPLTLTAVYASCPQEFIDSGECVKSNGWTCCPDR